MASRSQKADAPADADGRAEIEAQVARVREELATLGGLIAEHGRDRLRDVEIKAIDDLQRQLSAFETDMRRKVQEQPLQTLGLAALAGLILGLVLRR